MGTLISPVSTLAVASMDTHLKNRNKAGMTKSKVRKIEKVIAKRNGIIIVQRINIKTLLRMERDCQMTVICRRLSENSRDNSEKTDCNFKYTLCH